MPEYLPNETYKPTSGPFVVTLDIETIPTQRVDLIERLTAQAKAPSNYKDPEKIAAAIKEKAEDLIAKTALDGAFGEVWCICWSVNSGPVQFVTRRELDDPEEVLAEDFFASLGALTEGQEIRWRGHNVAFDLRFLWQRSLVLGARRTVDLKPDAKPWEHEDTILRWAGPREMVSLGNLCLALGIESGDEIKGKDVWSRVQIGDWQSVLNHCMEDVRRVNECWERMR